jgi:uncharacterized protein YbjT (DUF2867 family)
VRSATSGDWWCSTIARIEDPSFDGFPYYEAKRTAKEIVLDGRVPVTLVKSTQWYEFATHPAAVNSLDGEVVVEDWLIQPIAADTVADVLVEAALGQTPLPRTIAGPEAIRLPELTTKVLARHGDSAGDGSTPPTPLRTRNLSTT